MGNKKRNYQGRGHKNLVRACLVIRGSKQNLMKMRTNFHKFSINSWTIDIKFGGIGATLMELQPIHQLPNRLLESWFKIASAFLAASCSAAFLVFPVPVVETVSRFRAISNVLS